MQLNNLSLLNGTQLYTGAPPETDPYYQDVILLAHFDGANGSNIFVDNSRFNRTITPVGGATLSTTKFKWGTASYGSTNTSGRYISMDVGANGTLIADFTIEFWLNWTVDTIALYFPNRTYIYNGVFNLEWIGGPQLSLYPINVTNQWNHYAVTRQGTTLRGFYNGVLRGTNTFSGTVDVTSILSGYFPPNNNLYFNGYLDDLRITKGVARYTANFTPPTGPFPNS